MLEKPEEKKWMEAARGVLADAEAVTGASRLEVLLAMQILQLEGILGALETGIHMEITVKRVDEDGDDEPRKQEEK